MVGPARTLIDSTRAGPVYSGSGLDPRAGGAAFRGAWHLKRVLMIVLSTYAALDPESLSARRVPRLQCSANAHLQR